MDSLTVPQSAARLVFASAFLAQALVPGPAAAGPVVVLKSKSIPAYDRALLGLRAGYGGALITFDLGGRIENGPAIARVIAARKPGALVTIGAKAAQVARAHLASVPLVYCLVLHPEDMGLSGKGVHGIPLRVPASEQIQALRRLAPRVRRLGLLANPRTAAGMVREAQEAARAAGVTVILAEVTDAKEVPAALERLFSKIEALWLLPDSAIVSEASLRFLLLESFRRRLPVLAFGKDLVRRGALVALSPDYEGMGKAAGALVKEILAGRPPPAPSPPAARLAVNAATARRLGLRLPADVVSAADVIE
jgi:putative ABC transport system substrate-binding protein